MSTRDVWHERLVEHLQGREWTDVQIINLTHKIGHSAMLSSQAVLEVLEYQDSIDNYQEPVIPQDELPFGEAIA